MGAAARLQALERGRQHRKKMGGKKRASGTSDLRCLKGHELERFETPEAGFYCDVCGELQMKSAVMHGCEECEWDACESCFAARGSKSEAQKKAAKRHRAAARLQ